MQQVNRITDEPKMQQAASSAQQTVEECKHAVEEAVREHPLPAAMVAFGIGIGVGTAIGGLLADSQQARHRYLAQSLGNRMLRSASDLLPDNIRETFSS